jgi:membrane associated rhomboid family serine protease
MSFGPPVTPDVVKQLVIANVVAFVLQTLSFGRGGADALARLGAITPSEFWGGAVWQPFTYLFLHGGVFHLAMNMLTLWMFGSPLALAWGTRRFLELYFVSGVGAGLLIAVLPYVLSIVGLHFPSMSAYASTLGASGAVYGVILAYSLTWPNRTIMLIFPPVAMRAIWLIPALFLLEAWSGGGNISHTGHLGGVAMAWLWMQRRNGGRLLPTVTELRWRWQRWRMRGRLAAVRREEADARARSRTDNDRRLH